MSTQVLHRDDLPLGGFAGLKEHRLIMSPTLFKQSAESESWPGIGHLVYLADVRFKPHGETHMHDHREVDIISIMLQGRIQHQGSLEDGQLLTAGMVQVQRAGEEGFSHNEINPDNTTNRMLQLWVLPEQKHQAADYRVYQTQPGAVTRVYGGATEQSETFTSQTIVEVVTLATDQTYQLDKTFLAYMAKGWGCVNKISVQEGDLIKGENLKFQVKEDAQLIVMYTEE